MRRKFESADPLRRGARRPPSSALKAAAQRGARSGTAPASTSGRSLNGHPSSSAGPQGAPPGVPPASDLTKRQPPAEMAGSGFQEFALKMCTDEDLASSRYHVLKFFSRAPVDPAGQFTPPIRLHRKDPRQLQVVAGMEEEEDEEDVKMDAEGAPSQGGAEGAPQFERAKKRPFGSKRKTRQIHGGEKNDAARKLRYEEHYPWVMEDFDNKNTWISSYEAAQSNHFAVLAYDASSNGFKVIPLEKYYKMTPSARYATLSLEDAEERMESAHNLRDRWLMSNLQPRVSAAGQLVNPDQLEGGPHGAGGYGGGPRLRTVVGGEERKPKYNMDEEMDYDDQEMFDDDEGAPLLDGPEEDLKEAEQRIKQEHMKANEFLDVGRDNDIDNLFEDDESREDKQGRRVRKALRSLEKNQYYDTDDEENPYASESDSDSEDEIERVQQQLQQQQNGEEGSPSKVKGELDVDMGNVIPLVSSFRKRHIDRSTLPRGTVVLQLPPKLLSNFPKGSWNPNIKREEVPAQGSSAAGEESDPNLLTREDVVSHIVSGQTNIKELLTALRPKLAMHPDNQERLKRLVKEVAKSKDKKLYLR